MDFGSNRNTADPLRRAGLTLGVLAAIPLIETFLYNLHVANGRSRLSAAEYLQLLIFAVLLALIMVFAFILPQATFRTKLAWFVEHLRQTQAKLRARLVYVLLALPLAFLLMFFGGQAGVQLLVSTGLLGTVFLPLAQLAAVAVLIWLVAKLLRILGHQFTHLRGALEEWGFSVKVAILFYLLLVAATVRLVNLSGINPDARLEFALGITKDYLLLFIIANMLYAGLYKVADARSLKVLFQTDKGFLHFVLICGIIAILAIWADFNGMSPDNQQRIFRESWQRRYNTVHVYLRDIGLLLLPIGWLLFWSLLRFSEELRAQRGAGDTGKASGRGTS